MDPNALTRQQSREFDQCAIAEWGYDGIVLMENAGRGVVDVLLQRDPTLVDGNDVRPMVTILCGKGNNAGDGLVIARHLEIRGARSQVILLAPPGKLAGDTLRNYNILTHTAAQIVDLSTYDDLPTQLDQHAGGRAWLVDCMLGTGAVGKPREPYHSVIEWMNRQSGRRLAVDVPSGLDCNTGQAAEPTVRADITCTFVAQKTGFLKQTAQPFLGEVHVVSIGIPPSLLEMIKC